MASRVRVVLVLRVVVPVGDLVGSVDPGLFWGLVCGWVLGGLTVWRFARYVERFRDAVRHARHHFARSVEFVRFARSNVAGMVAASALVAVSAGVIATLVFMRLSGDGG